MPRPSPQSSGDDIAFALRSLGWLLLIWDALIVIYVPIDLRAGSDLWMWWSAVEFVAGTALLLAGHLL